MANMQELQLCQDCYSTIRWLNAQQQQELACLGVILELSFVSLIEQR